MHSDLGRLRIGGGGFNYLEQRVESFTINETGTSMSFTPDYIDMRAIYEWAEFVYPVPDPQKIHQRGHSDVAAASVQDTVLHAQQ